MLGSMARSVLPSPFEPALCGSRPRLARGFNGTWKIATIRANLGHVGVVAMNRLPPNKRVSHTNANNYTRMAIWGALALALTTRGEILPRLSEH